LLLERCQAELDDLMQQFRSPRHRRRVLVYLFARGCDIERALGRPSTGGALTIANAIVIADDAPHLQETIRHELMHLFSARWNANAPPLLSEGVCVWVSQTVGGRDIDAAARLMVRTRTPKMEQPFQARFFYSPAHRHCCYVLAGSFPGFLVRRFGWKPYRKLYRLCDGFTFRGKFKHCFGVSLEEAEGMWREEILASDVVPRF